MSDRLGEELEEVSNLISKKFIPEIIRIADIYNYERDCLIKYVANLFFTMAEVATFENYNASHVSNLEHMNNWIPVSERIPENNDDVLVYDGLDIFVAWYSRVDTNWCSADNRLDEYTSILAWQPLPEPYKTESEDMHEQ